MAYRIKTDTSSRTGMQAASQFWSSHSSVSIKDRTLEDSGIPLDFRDGKAVLSAPENHCMICAASGKGKTRRELYPAVIMAARAGRSLVIADMKGEIFKNTGATVKQCGHEIKIINLRNPSCSDRYSPLSIVQKYWRRGDRSRAMILLKDTCAIVTEKLRCDRDKFWENAAQDLILGFAILLLEKDAPLTFCNIHSLINEYFGEKEFRDEYIARLDRNAESFRRLATVVNLESDTTLSCVLSEANASLSCFVDQRSVRNLLSASDIELTDIGRKPSAVYLMCPDESTALYGIASLFIEQCYSELINFADSTEGNRLPVKVDFILDEFGSFVGSDWPSKLTAARSRGIRFVLAIQALSQMVARYGESGARTIMANCRTLVFMGGRDLKLLNEISMLSGTMTDERIGIARPVLSINDLSTLPMGEIVVLDDSGLPYIGHLPEWSNWEILGCASQQKAVHTDEEADLPVSLRTLLGISADSPRQDIPDEPLPTHEADEEDALEKAVRRGMTIQSILQKLDSDPEFTEQLQRLLEGKDRPVTKIDDDDDLPF